MVVPFVSNTPRRGIPDARFIPLDSANDLILEHEPTCSVFRDAVLEFLSEDDG